MKKFIITAIIGSSREENSISRNMANKLFKKIENNFTEVDIDFKEYLLNENIELCTGCMLCFKSGMCSINDDLKDLKARLKESHLILLMSPVFFHHVTARMKKFIDRTAFWSHYLGLTGKLGITVSVSSNNGNDETNKYLKKHFDYTGVHIINQISILYLNETENTVDYKIDFCINNLKHILKNRSFTVNNEQEIIYDFFKNNYMDMIQRNVETYESNYWKNNIGFKFNSFKDYYLYEFEKQFIGVSI